MKKKLVKRELRKIMLNRQKCQSCQKTYNFNTINNAI